MKIAVCIITCLRPYSLEKLLSSLNNLDFKKNKNLKIKIFIVDNDINGSAKKAIKRISKNYRWRIEYCIESRRGIPFARNRAVKESLSWADFIAFIDDDEEADKYWLDELIHAQKITNAHCVSGPVYPRFEHKAPDWVLKGKFFEKSATLKVGRTGNCLIKSDVLKQFKTPFDGALALTGGEDSDFFRRARKKGDKIVWASKAKAYHLIPKSRVNIKWLVMRAYRGANGDTRLALKYFSFPEAFAKRICPGIYHLFQGIIGLPLSLIMGKSFLVKRLQDLSISLGCLAGFYGFEYQEYKKIHRIEKK
jgi:GT2 family glycosyltransferase